MKIIKLSVVLIGLLCLGNFKNVNAQTCEVKFVAAKEVKLGFMLEWKIP